MRALNESGIRSREGIPARYTWNAPSVFESDGAWEDEVTAFAESLSDFRVYQGRLQDGGGVLATALEARDGLLRRLGKVLVYASMNHSLEMTDQSATRAVGRARGLGAQVSAVTAFLEPELLAIGQSTIKKWMQEEPRLAVYAHYIEDLFRKGAHIRSPEVEEVLGMLADPFGSVHATADMLTAADFRFQPAVTQDGQEMPVTQGTWTKILACADREARRTAWEHYTDEYLAFKNTLAANLTSSIKQNVFQTRARRHASTLEAALFEHNIPVEVYHNLIATFRENLPTWHRYWRIRRQALGVDTLHPYDIWAPLTADSPVIPYEQAIEWICQGLLPLGEDYVDIVRRGAVEERWVDVYPNQGKRGGAFSSGSPGTHPFIMMSYNDNVFSLSTLAHELGHSMHSYLTWQDQPFVYSDYSLFLAEVASNFHQAMVRAYLMEQQPDPTFQISLIEEAMSNFHRYFFIMPTLARFELEVHERAERGEGLTADDMIELMADLSSEGFGSGVYVDRDRVGITWATFGHLYVDYYVFQYATGISGANALARRILSGHEGALDDYLSFLKSGSSMYPLDALKMAGVDLTTTEAVEVTFEVLSDLVDRLESLLGG